MQLSVFHAPEEVPDLSAIASDQSPDCAIVIDVLRATTTIATALHAGAEAVQTYEDLADLDAAASEWPDDRRIRSGERGGKMVDGYDLGNSPLDYVAERVTGKRIFMSTTNGTRALSCVKSAPTVLTAALVNVSSVVSHVLDRNFGHIWIVNSGWQGAYALEDSVCAGAIALALKEQSSSFKEMNDEAIAAMALYHQWQDNLLGLMRSASHGQRLLRLGQDADLACCAALDTLDVVPQQSTPGVLIAG
ncbi:MAG: 2-phosphosulfolactate phosphatase family protein [Synechococcus sp.]